MSSITASSDGNSGLAIDSKGLSALKGAAHSNSPEAIKNVAKQFEAIFLNMMLKSMRNATPQDGPLDSEQSKSFTSMLDQQLSQNIANKGIGLAEVLVRQLSQNKSVDPSAKPTGDETKTGETSSWDASKGRAQVNIQSSTGWTSPSLAKLSSYGLRQYGDNNRDTDFTADTSQSMRARIAEFSNRMAAAADKVSRASGIPQIFIMAQAALESGWGKSEIMDANGRSSHNLFGIKATDSWTGRVVEAQTTEYIDGQKVSRVEKFRAYDSYQDSFKDFANLLRRNPRYQQVLKSVNDPVSYSHAMQRSGYATDPNYGKKLQSVILSFMANLE